MPECGKRKEAGYINSKLIAGAAALSAGLIADSQCRLQTTDFALSFGALPPEFRGFRIVLLSDLHGRSFGRDNARLIRTVLSLEPDIVALTGDMAGSLRELRVLPPLLEALSGAAPVYAVHGNHEWYGGCAGEAARLMERYGVRLLSDSYEPLLRGGARIVICGAEDPASGSAMAPPLLARRLREEYPEDFTLWLTHRNSYAAKHWALPVQLVLCGHAHGGMIRLPGLGGLCSVSYTPVAEYEAGLYCGRDFVMAVSRGLASGCLLPRLFNRPEIVRLTLTDGSHIPGLPRI